MVLVSCEYCGVVLDLKRMIREQDEIPYDDETNDTYTVSYFTCPVCSSKIDDDGDLLDAYS